MLIQPNTDEKSELMMMIEVLRKKMIQTGLKEGLSSKNTLSLSQQLDEIITKYQESSYIESA